MIIRMVRWFPYSYTSRHLKAYTFLPRLEPVTEKSVEDFIAEIELMKRIGDHENIIRMLGCCTVTSPICLIMEYAPHGNLLAYLKAAKTKVRVSIKSVNKKPTQYFF